MTLPQEVLYSGCLSLAAVTFLSGISWGVMTSLYSVCMWNLVRTLLSAKATRETAVLTGWITVLWILSSTSTIANAYWGINVYSWKTDYPGGPVAYLIASWNKPIPVLGYTTYAMTTWFADAWMLKRLVIFYQGVHYLIRGPITSFAFLIYIGSVGTACYVITILVSDQTLDAAYVMRAAIPCLVLSMTLNVFVTVAIVLRLLYFKSLVERTLGRDQAKASPYTNIVAMLEESAALYAIWTLVLVILYAMRSPVQNVLVVMLCDVQVIAPLLIVYRVSKGIDWERDASPQLASRTMVFATGGATFTLEQQESVPRVSLDQKTIV